MNIEKKNIGIGILLTIVTCGLYGLFWMVGVIDDSCKLRNHKTTGTMDLLLTIVTCGLYGIYVSYKIGANIDAVRIERGLGSGNNAIIYLVLSLFGFNIITYALAQHNINELC